MTKSNFTAVRLSKDGSTVEITGTSDPSADLSELQVAVTSPKPVDPKRPGEDLAPLGEQSVARPAIVLPGTWTAEVANVGGRLKPGGMVLLAGTAVHRTGDLGVETWIGCTTVLAGDDEKPV